HVRPTRIRVPRSCHARSTSSRSPVIRAQFAQQYMTPSDSTPCPRIRHPQCAHVGASACTAHSKLSYTPPPSTVVTVNVLSYEFPHTSQTAMVVNSPLIQGDDAEASCPALRP